MRKILLAALALGSIAIQPAQAQEPAKIKLGTLYASTGRSAAISVPVHTSLKMWIDQKNEEGGVFIKAFNKKIPIELIAYDNQSTTATAATLYNRLITQDKVDLLVADSGSILTSVAVPIAREHKMLLINQNGTGTSFFSKDNPYIVLTSNPVASRWPQSLVDFTVKQKEAVGIKRAALLYSTNDFCAAEATTVRERFKQAGIELVYDQGVPTDTSNYTVIINNIRAANPDVVIHFGYPPNDIAFLRNIQDSGAKFKMLFSSYPGLEQELLTRNVGAAGLGGIFTYVPSTALNYPVNFGMNMQEFIAMWRKKGGGHHLGLNAVAGYTTGLVLEKALAEATSLDQLELRRAIFAQSGKLKTLAGTFELNEEGAQVGMSFALGQMAFKPGDTEAKLVVIHPEGEATGKPVFQSTK
jgi:branched-chain amino acid transport system substrate-binding protein